MDLRHSYSFVTQKFAIYFPESVEVWLVSSKNFFCLMDLDLLLIDSKATRIVVDHGASRFSAFADVL